MPRNKIPEWAIVNDLKKVDQEVEGNLSRPVYQEKGAYGTTTIENKFGSWNEAKEAAGLHIEQANHEGDDIENDQILFDIRWLNEQVEGDLTYREYDDRGLVSCSTVADRFGSFNEAKEKAGLEVKNINPPSTKEVIRDFTEVHEKLGRPPQAFEYYEHGRFSHTTLKRHLDAQNWREVLEAMNLKPQTSNG